MMSNLHPRALASAGEPPQSVVSASSRLGHITRSLLQLSCQMRVASKVVATPHTMPSRIHSAVVRQTDSRLDIADRSLLWSTASPVIRFDNSPLSSMLLGELSMSGDVISMVPFKCVDRDIDYAPALRVEEGRFDSVDYVFNRVPCSVTDVLCQFTYRGSRCDSCVVF